MANDDLLKLKIDKSPGAAKKGVPRKKIIMWGAAAFILIAGVILYFVG
jgi:uncharacterized membrane protein YvbJ